MAAEAPGNPDSAGRRAAEAGFENTDRAGRAVKAEALPAGSIHPVEPAGRPRSDPMAANRDGGAARGSFHDLDTVSEESFLQSGSLFPQRVVGLYHWTRRVRSRCTPVSLRLSPSQRRQGIL